jgi:hypothetical protein
LLSLSFSLKAANFALLANENESFTTPNQKTARRGAGVRKGLARYLGFKLFCISLGLRSLPHHDLVGDPADFNFQQWSEKL